MGLPTFRKGVHPEDNKAFTNQKVIEFLPLPGEVFIPLQQHIGVSGEVLYCDDPVQRVRFFGEKDDKHA